MPSSKDVAKLAGVSQTTVSRVLNCPESVKDKTREKVLKAIDELGYIPDANARSLVGQKTHTISLISGPLHNPFYIDSTTEIVNYANQVGYKVNVHFTDGQTQPPYDFVLGNKIDGLIMSCVLRNDPIVERLQRLALPFVSFNRKHDLLGNYVEIDNFEAGKLAAEHLLALGHRNIVWLGGYDSASTFHNRYQGFKAVIDQSRLALSDLNIRTICYEETDNPDLAAMLGFMAGKSHSPTAICAATDSLAIDAINQLRAFNYSVPDDISVIGIDNVYLSGTPLIQLTTVGVLENRSIAREAIKNLINLIEYPGSLSDGSIRLTEPVTLYPRSTTRSVKA